MTLKTVPTGASVTAFLRRIRDPERRRDCQALLRLMRQATKSRPAMWGPSIVGFGRYHYRYASGREGDWFFAGFSPRKRDLTLYLMAGVGRYPSLLKRLGTHKRGGSCLYLRRLGDVDLATLRQLVRRSVADMKRLSTRTPHAK
jgi:Domain of unknown function (DU1801)